VRASAAKAAAPTVAVEGHPVRRLNQAEMEERRRLGLCYNCDEKYGHGHNKVCKRLFLLDSKVEDEDDDTVAGDDDVPETESPVFSLHAVAGVARGNTMQVQVTLGRITLVALLDTGSTHSFIAEAAAERTGLPIQPRPRLTATVANGEKVPCPGVIRHAPLVVDNIAFCVDLFVMPLAGYDVVLGTQWMATLGRLVWDFVAGTVSFQHHDRTVCWSGVPSLGALEACAATSSTPLLDELLAGFEDVFAEPRGLPPKRARDHPIVLKPGAQPVVV